jgi:hypothetical protein
VLSLRFTLGLREVKRQRDDILEWQSLIFIWYRERYSRITRGTKKMLGLPQG